MLVLIQFEICIVYFTHDFNVLLMHSLNECIFEGWRETLHCIAVENCLWLCSWFVAFVDPWRHNCAFVCMIPLSHHSWTTWCDFTKQPPIHISHLTSTRWNDLQEHLRVFHCPYTQEMHPANDNAPSVKPERPDNSWCESETFQSTPRLRKRWIIVVKANNDNN